MSNNKINIESVWKQPSNLNLSSNNKLFIEPPGVGLSPRPYYPGIGLSPRPYYPGIGLSPKTETNVFPDSSYISPKRKYEAPKEPPPIKRRYSIVKSESISNSSYNSPKEASKLFTDPPTLKRCNAIAPSKNEEESSNDEDGKTLEYVEDGEDKIIK